MEHASTEASAWLTVGSACPAGSAVVPIVEPRRGDAALDVDALCTLFSELCHDDAPVSDKYPSEVLDSTDPPSFTGSSSSLDVASSSILLEVMVAGSSTSSGRGRRCRGSSGSG